MKDKTPKLSKANVVYKFTCPGCSTNYIGKTDRNLKERCIEHATSKNSAIFEHLMNCLEFDYITKQLHYGISNLSPNDKRNYVIECVSNNTDIIDTSLNWNILLIKEALYIKRMKPMLNNGLKASRELFLFS